jgi:hypothetical protein
MTIDPTPSTVFVRADHALAPKAAQGIAFIVSTRHRWRRLGARSLAQALWGRLRAPEGRDELSPQPQLIGDRARPGRSALSLHPMA